jgi:hypothetical protein
MKIDELERLLAEASPGPWEAKRDYSKDWLIAGHGKILVDSMDSGPHGERDIRLIAAARNALPALLRVARAARELEEILATVAADADAADVLVMRRHAARAELRAALAALEGAPDA